MKKMDDPFYSTENMERLRKNRDEMERGRGTVHMVSLDNARLEVPNSETAEAVVEGQCIIADEHVKGYKSVKDLKAALDE